MSHPQLKCTMRRLARELSALADLDGLHRRKHMRNALRAAEAASDLAGDRENLIENFPCEDAL